MKIHIICRGTANINPTSLVPQRLYGASMGLLAAAFRAGRALYESQQVSDKLP